MQKIKEIWIFIKKNKKIFAALSIILFFSIVIVFIDTDNLINSIQRIEKIYQIEHEIQILEQKIDVLNEENNQNSSIVMEKYAREVLLMKRDNEDIFIVDTMCD
jgi:cell division protein FtsB